MILNARNYWGAAPKRFRKPARCVWVSSNSWWGATVVGVGAGLADLADDEIIDSPPRACMRDSRKQSSANRDRDPHPARECFGLRASSRAMASRGTRIRGPGLGAAGSTCCPARIRRDWCGPHPQHDRAVPGLLHADNWGTAPKQSRKPARSVRAPRNAEGGATLVGTPG